MKHLILCAALAFAGAVQATGPHDGMWINPGTRSFAAVKTDGSTVSVVVTTLQSNVGNPSSAVGSAPTSHTDLWEGSITGQAARLTGVISDGACNAAMAMSFSATSATTTIVQATQTAVGQQSGVNCAALVSLPPQTLLRMGAPKALVPGF